MGRVSKYKKIKSHDPFYRGPRRSNRAVDLCPENEDEQPVPKSLVRLMRRADDLKRRGNMKKKKKSLLSDECTVTQSRSSDKTEAMSRAEREGDGSSKEGPMFRKRRGESLKSYLERIDIEANSRVMEAFRKNRKSSERRRRRLEERKRKALARKKGSCQDDQVVEFTDLRDDVKFGEVVQAPPQIRSKPRGSKPCPSTSKPPPFCQKVTLSGDKSEAPRPSQTRVGLKRKRDLELEREHVISIYRHQKKTALSKANALF